MTLPYPGLGRSQIERLALLAESTARVALLIGRTLRNGYDTSELPDSYKNRERIEFAIGDMMAALSLMFERSDLDYNACVRRAAETTKSLNRNLHHNSVKSRIRKW